MILLAFLNEVYARFFVKLLTIKNREILNELSKITAQRLLNIIYTFFKLFSGVFIGYFLVLAKSMSVTYEYEFSIVHHVHLVFLTA